MKSRSWHRTFLGFALILFSAVLASAAQINWRGLANRDHQSSNGQPLTGNVIFELGAFSAGFIPSSDNTALWAEHWSPIDRARYQESRQVFTSSLVLSSNQAPFSVGQPAYIWGYQTDSEASEWILLRRPSWTWPSPSLTALPLSWIVSLTETDVILGSINGEAYLRTAAVDAGSPLPSISPLAWQAQYFTTDELSVPSITDWNADPDGDGLPNRLEYAYATHPKEATKPIDFIDLVVDGLANTATLLFTRRSDRLVSYTAEYSRDRIQWFPIDQRTSNRLSDGLRSDRYILSTDGLSHELYRSHITWLTD